MLPHLTLILNLFVISVIDSKEMPWKGFNVKPEQTCKVTYEGPVGSQIAINFIEMDMKGEGAGGEGCNADYVKLQDTTDTPHGLIGGDKPAKKYLASKRKSFH